MKNWFKDWFNSPYYHLLYQHRDEVEAQLFVENIIRRFNLTSKQTLLDVACGKGRHAMAFNQLGLDVTGIDLSSESIDYALSFSNDTLHFYVHDMRQTFRTNYYDIVCNLFTSFGYFSSHHDNILAARAMYQAVKKNGTILIDFVNRSHALNNIMAKPFEEIEREGVRFSIERAFDETQFLKTIHVFDNNEQLIFHERLSSFTLDEMKAIFLKVGFTFQEVFGNYQFDAYDEENSPRMITIFRK